MPGDSERSAGRPVRGTIITHLDDIAPAAAASQGSISIIRKSAIQMLWRAVVDNMTDYRERWSVDDVEVRKAAAAAVTPNLPAAGWFSRALTHDAELIGEGELLAEWP